MVLHWWIEKVGEENKMSLDLKFIDLELSMIKDDKIKQYKMDYFLERVRSEAFLGLKDFSLKAYLLKQYFKVFYGYIPEKKK